MDDIEIVELEHKYLVQVENWPSRHSATDTLLKLPAETTGQPGNYGWAVLHDDEVLAVATVKLNKERVGYLNCIVKPASKRKGVGTLLVEYVLNQPPVNNLTKLHAVIEPANTAARQVLKEQGFTMIGNDSNGYLEYAKHKHF